MDITEKILEALTKDDIIELMNSFGVEHEITSNGDLRFQAHCHGKDSKKLYYYEKDADGEVSKHFLCYSNCGGMSVYTTFMEINNWSFKETLDYLARFKGISIITKKEKKFGSAKKVIKDWDFINKYKKLEKAKQKTSLRKLPDFNKRVMNVFDDVYPSSWEDEGITTIAMKRFDISFYLTKWKAIIPHYDIWGRLIGIRGRAFLQQDIDSGKKYMPAYIENESYRHPLQYNLYGLYQNSNSIKKLRKAIIFEGEKSVLLCESYYPENNFSVAICGSNLSNYQRDLLVHEMKVEEVIIAIDKQYKTHLETEDDIKEYHDYIRKVKKIADRFVNYVNVYIVYCDDDRLNYKDAPSDKGKKVLEELMREKERYYKEE